MNDNSALILRWQKLRANIEMLAKQYPASEPCKLLAVSKYASAAAVRELYQVGQQDFAENYWQSAQEKMWLLQDCAITWHFIGQVQSNKCAQIAQNFTWLHSLAKLKHVELLANAREGYPPLEVCLQVNLSADPNKYGVLPEALDQIVEAVLAFPSLRLRGLMVLPKAGETKDFIVLATLRDQLTQKFKIQLPTLSMGMSDDYPQAIAAGATIVRVGSALFGE